MYITPLSASKKKLKAYNSENSIDTWRKKTVTHRADNIRESDAKCQNASFVKF